jgi:hypothetical protein
MTTYEYGRIARLAENMEKAGIAPEIAGRILEGGEGIRRSTKNEAIAAWMKGAMDRMDQLLEPETRHAVREACACCLTGKRLQLSKAIARNHATLEERIRAANETPYVFGHGVTQQDDGTIRVQFFPDGLESYRCPCMPKAAEPLSITYCYCCGGHAKHHLQIALGHKLDVEVIHTALSSGGKQPCAFAFTILE